MASWLRARSRRQPSICSPSQPPSEWSDAATRQVHDRQVRAQQAATRLCTRTHQRDNWALVVRHRELLRRVPAQQQQARVRARVGADRRKGRAGEAAWQRPSSGTSKLAASRRAGCGSGARRVGQRRENVPEAFASCLVPCWLRAEVGRRRLREQSRPPSPVHRIAQQQPHHLGLAVVARVVQR